MISIQINRIYSILKPGDVVIPEDKKSVLTHAPAILAASAGLITAVVGLLSFMSTPAPTIAGFDATPNIVGLGESSVLKWSVTGSAESVDIEPGIGIVALSGSREVTPLATTNYTLTAKNKDQVKTATLQLVVTEKKVSQIESQAENSSETKEPQTPAPAPAPAQTPNVIVVTVPAASSSTPAASVQTTGAQTTSAQIQSEPARTPAAQEPAGSGQAVSMPSSNINAASMQESSTQVNVETPAPVGGAPESVPQEAAVQAADATAEIAQNLTSAPAYQPAPDMSSSAPASSAQASEPPAAVSIGTGPDASSGVKQITSADWNPSDSNSSTLDEMSQEAPIYSKLRSSSGHQPGQSSDSSSMGSASSSTPVSSSQVPDPMSMAVPTSELP